MTAIRKDMSDDAILAELGERLRHRRLRLNLPQEEMANNAGLAVGTIKNLEKGAGTLLSLIAALRALNELEQLDNVLAAQLVSPMMMMKMRKPRQRARGKNE